MQSRLDSLKCVGICGLVFALLSACLLAFHIICNQNILHWVFKLNFHWFLRTLFLCVSSFPLREKVQDTFCKCLSMSRNIWRDPRCSFLVQSGFHSLHLAPPHWQANGSVQTLDTVSICRRERKRAIFIRLRPKLGSTYCQKNFHTLRDEFKKDPSSHSQEWRRPSDCCYQNSFPHPEKERHQSHEERGGADFPPHHWVNAGSYLSEGMIRLYWTPSLSKHEFLRGPVWNLHWRPSALWDLSCFSDSFEERDFVGVQ